MGDLKIEEKLKEEQLSPKKSGLLSLKLPGKEGLTYKVLVIKKKKKKKK